MENLGQVYISDCDLYVPQPKEQHLFVAVIYVNLCVHILDFEIYIQRNNIQENIN